MLNGKIETRGRTTEDGKLDLRLDLGVPNAEVEVSVHIRVSDTEPLSNGWPNGFFEKLAGSMPELKRAPQGEFEKRSTPK